MSAHVEGAGCEAFLEPCFQFRNVLRNGFEWDAFRAGRCSSSWEAFTWRIVVIVNRNLLGAARATVPVTMFTNVTHNFYVIGGNVIFHG